MKRSDKPAALEQATQFKLVAGDNAPESKIAAVKLQLRRQNRIGRGSPAVAHIDRLAGTRLNDAPGLQTVLAAWLWSARSVRPKSGVRLGTSSLFGRQWIYE